MLSVLKGTPLYVWGIFIYFVFLGIKALKTREVSLFRLAISPCVLFFLALTRILKASDENLIFISLALYFLGVLVALGVLRTKSFVINIESKTIKSEGSSLFLLVFLSIFTLKYYFGYRQATAQSSVLLYLESVLFYFISGVFGGRFLTIYRAYRLAIRNFKQGVVASLTL